MSKPDFWEGYVPEPVKPAQQEPKIDIYRSFEQWKSGNVLEHGVPRTEHYSEAQLDLVEMGWNYGYDAGRAVEQALDKKAENARELGLDYEPAPATELREQEPVAWEQFYPEMGKPKLAYLLPTESTENALYTSPPAQRTWVGLTNNELQPIADEYRILFGSWVEDFARAIEAKLKEKNNG